MLYFGKGTIVYIDKHKLVRIYILFQHIPLITALFFSFHHFVLCENGMNYFFFFDLSNIQ